MPPFALVTLLGTPVPGALQFGTKHINPPLVHVSSPLIFTVSVPPRIPLPIAIAVVAIAFGVNCPVGVVEKFSVPPVIVTAPAFVTTPGAVKFAVPPEPIVPPAMLYELPV